MSKLANSWMPLFQTYHPFQLKVAILAACQICTIYYFSMTATGKTRGDELEEQRQKQPKGIDVVELENASPSAASQNNDTAQPHLHAKTYFAVAAVCLVYVAQMATLVGAGSVSNSLAASMQQHNITV